MNYLAHLYLAEDSPESLLGNLMGDFVKGFINNMDYSEAIVRGIKLHRQVDTYTDSHAIFLRSKRLIEPTNRRYAGIIIDVFYDHFLAKCWSDYSAQPLPEFAAKVYNVLEDYHNILPETLQRIVPRIVAENWLMSYADIEGIETVLIGLSRRIKRQNSLAMAVEDLRENYDRLLLDFEQFFPELVSYVNTLRG